VRNHTTNERHNGCSTQIETNEKAQVMSLWSFRLSFVFSVVGTQPSKNSHDSLPITSIEFQKGEPTMPGQPELFTNNVFIGINCTTVNVEDPNGTPSNLIIQSSDPFNVWMTFDLQGTFALWIASLNVPYTISYFYEGVGGAADGLLATVNHNTILGQTHYDKPETLATIPAGTLAPGLYNLTTVVSFGGSPPMTAFESGPMIQVF